MATRPATRSERQSRTGQPARKESEDVVAFIRALKHPHEAEILALRKIILGVDRSIAEEIKWNAPSFRTTESFATFHLRARHGLQLVLHRGARIRAGSVSIDDPKGLLQWRDTDRAIVVFESLDDVRAQKTALVKVLKQWITHV